MSTKLHMSLCESDNNYALRRVKYWIGDDETVYERTYGVEYIAYPLQCYHLSSDMEYGDKYHWGP